jgi:hypothetical protein
MVVSPSAQAGSTLLTINANTKALSNFNVRGSISKGSGTFVIDHPLYPATKLLYHSFVESPDVKNIYDGVATLNSAGEVAIQLPQYFDVLNKSVRYQFFPFDTAMPGLYIKEQEHNNQFTIGGGTPGGRVSWQVTGIRHDPYIRTHPITPEVDKGPGQPVAKGECLFKPLCQ